MKGCSLSNILASYLDEMVLDGMDPEWLLDRE